MIVNTEVFNMYFPYLRGRQYELIALREMLEKELLSEYIIPVIEPVKLSTTLIKTLEVYKKAHRTIALITNPAVGDFLKEIKNPKNEKQKNDLVTVLESNHDILYFRILNNQEGLEDFIKRHDKVGTISTNADSALVYEKYLKNYNIMYNLIPDESLFRRKIRANRVLLAERFNKQKRNEDYATIIDEPFSEDHIYFEEDGYIGFSDYSVIGREYMDTGFAPYAVAIHMVYLNEEQGMRIRHFVSDTNDDISDIARKFSEALTKLVEWNKIVKLDTYAIGEFNNLYNMQSYPGLGTVKKLSIMHHLEIIGKYLDEVNR